MAEAKRARSPRRRWVPGLTNMQLPKLDFPSVVATIAMVVSLATLYLTYLRPAHLILGIAAISATYHGGPHLSIPMSISNDGSKLATILNAKVTESRENSTDQTSYVVALTAAPEKAVDPMIGAATKDNSAPFIPFVVGPNSELQRVLILPLDGKRPLASSNQISHFKIALKTMTGDVLTEVTIRWPADVTALLAANRGVVVPTFDVGVWQDQPVR